MIRIKKNIKLLEKKKTIFSFLKSSKFQKKTRFKIINQKYKRALYYSYLQRKKKFKNKVWLQRLTYLKEKDFKYNKFIKNFKLLSIKLNKKILSQLHLLDKKTFLIITKIKALYAHTRTIN